MFVVEALEAPNQCPTTCRLRDDRADPEISCGDRQEIRIAQQRLQITVLQQ
jgi:hypothetical protein